MNSRLLLCLAVVGLNLSASARIGRIWSDAELMKTSDLVVIAQPISTKVLDETNSLGYSSTKSFRSRFRGVETTFKVLDVLKGMPKNDRIVLHHYRVELEWGSPPNGPHFISFKTGTTNQYLLYLVKDGPNRYAPVTGQVDPWFPVKSMTNLPAAAPYDSLLKVAVVPSKTVVHVREHFNLSLLVENPTTTNQIVRVMWCSWPQQWQINSPIIHTMGFVCEMDFPRSIELPPGGSTTFNLEAVIPGPISIPPATKKLAFQMGFTPLDSNKTFWSKKVSIRVLPDNALKP